MQRAEKIILHGLFSSHLLYILTLQPWLLKKCHWVIWGGDLYVHQAELKDWRWEKNEFFRHRVIPHIGYLVTYVPGDLELARKWYGAKGKHMECLMYPSNIFTPVELPNVGHTTTTILIGNSADPSNNHYEVFDHLKKLEDQNFKLVCPLTYGDKDNAERIGAEGFKQFGDRFVPLLDFMPYEDYLKVLVEIDIAIFAHRRQQGMGNAITLLGLGKKVYMRSDVTPWAMFNGLGVKIFDLLQINLSAMDDSVLKENKLRIKDNFSKVMLIRQLHNIFKD